MKSLAMINSCSIVGTRALPVKVEVHLANGLPNFSMVGLPEATVKESKDRVRAAILNSGFEFPAKRITVNLAPADLPKSGGRFDLPIAIGILAASGQIEPGNFESYEFIGELALDGSIRKVKGVLPSVIATGQDKRVMILPTGNAEEAALATQIRCFHSHHLLKVCAHLVGQDELLSCTKDDRVPPLKNDADISEVKGQHHAKRALEIAASGGHSVLFIGPPGAGKSMLASRLPGILPELTLNEVMDVITIQSVAKGEFVLDDCIQRPFRSPHHSASAVAMVGGGSYPQPGEITMAHRGVLFLDELTEFSRSTLEQLREPLETGEINIARANQHVTYPAQFLLVAACNPCKCGFLGDGTDRCQCSATSIESYRAKLSGPLLDRIDMHIQLPRVDIKTLQNKDEGGETSDIIRQRVTEVRKHQQERQNKLNSELSSKELEHYCQLDKELLSFLETLSEKLKLSARAYHRILKLARTIADISNEEVIRKMHIAEAAGLRRLDRQ